MLCKFFNAMVNTIRLLRLKRLPITFAKLCPSIEYITKRNFTLHHLGQLKHIVHDIIDVKKIRVLDDETRCMKEDFLLSLDVDTDTVSYGAGYSRLKGIFHSRIVDFARTHPESDDMPEGELPDVFYKPKQDSETSLNDQTSVLQPTTLTASSFKRRFSSRANPSPQTPIKHASCSIPDYEVTSTPAKLVSTPARLMAATPTLRTPKRPLMVHDSDSGLPSKSVKRSRSLKFDDNDSDASNDLLGVLPAKLLHSLKEKERRTLEEKERIVSQAQMRKQLLYCVPKLFDIIRLLFQSNRHSAITKEELIYKILIGHSDVVDRVEVEGMLKLLQEIAPEFITEKKSLSGDILLRLNKSSFADTIRAKLLEAE